MSWIVGVHIPIYPGFCEGALKLRASSWWVNGLNFREFQGIHFRRPLKVMALKLLHFIGGHQRTASDAKIKVRNSSLSGGGERESEWNKRMDRWINFDKWTSGR